MQLHARCCTQSDGRLRMELVAHSRLLSAMDIHPSRDLLATVAEDGTLGVWEVAIATAKVRERRSTSGGCE